MIQLRNEYPCIPSKLMKNISSHTALSVLDLDTPIRTLILHNEPVNIHETSFSMSHPWKSQYTHLNLRLHNELKIISMRLHYFKTILQTLISTRLLSNSRSHFSFQYILIWTHILTITSEYPPDFTFWTHSSNGIFSWMCNLDGRF